MDRPWRRVPTYRAIHFRGSGGRGGSRPILLETESGTVLHVKLKHNPQSTRSLVNDWIGTGLAAGLGVPVPPMALVMLNREDLDAIPQLATLRWHPGHQFATHYDPVARPLTRQANLRTVSNLDTLPLAALVEAWLDNTDLKPSHLLIHLNRSATWFLTDHGFILPGGPYWTAASLRAGRHHWPSLHWLTHLARALGQPWRFQPALDAVMSVTADDLHDLFASVPLDWPLSSSARSALLHFFIVRQRLLAPVAARLQRLWNQAHG